MRVPRLIGVVLFCSIAMFVVAGCELKDLPPLPFLNSATPTTGAGTPTKPQAVATAPLAPPVTTALAPSGGGTGGLPPQVTTTLRSPAVPTVIGVVPSAVITGPIVPTIVVTGGVAPLQGLAGGMVKGQVVNALTSQPISNVELHAGSILAYTDGTGSFSFAIPAGLQVVVQATGYELQTVSLVAGAVATIALIPNPAGTWYLNFLYQRRGNFVAMWDLLHPDEKSRLPQSQFVQYYQRFVNSQILEAFYGPVQYLPTYTFRGKLYADAANVPLILKIQRPDGTISQLNPDGHMVRVDGTWHWFAGDLVEPTPVVVPTGTPIPASPTATSLPAGIPPNTPVVIVVPGGASLRTAPGNEFPQVLVVPAGAILTVIAGPTLINGIPWYFLNGPTGQGWVPALVFRVILGPVPNVTVSPVQPPPSPIPPTVPPIGPPYSGTPGATPGPPATYALGQQVRVVVPGGRLNIRADAGTSAPIVGYAANGETLTINQAAPKYVDGAPWYAVSQPSKGISGWVYGPYIQPIL